MEIEDRELSEVEIEEIQIGNAVEADLREMKPEIEADLHGLVQEIADAIRTWLEEKARATLRKNYIDD